MSTRDESILETTFGDYKGCTCEEIYLEDDINDLYNRLAAIELKRQRSIFSKSLSILFDVRKEELEARLAQKIAKLLDLEAKAEQERLKEEIQEQNKEIQKQHEELEQFRQRDFEKSIEELDRHFDLDEDDDDDDENINVFIDEDKIIRQFEEIIESNEELEKPHLYPENNHLLYLISYLGQFEKDDYCNFNKFSDIEFLVKAYRTRRDAPTFLRERIKEYLHSQLVQETAPKQSEQTRILHSANYEALERYREKQAEDHERAVQYIRNEYKKELKGKSIELLQPSPYANFEENYHHWIDKKKFREVFNQNPNTDKSGHFKRILNGEEYKEKLKIKDESIFTDLEESFPNFKEPIHFYKAQFRLAEVTGRDRIQPILLLGEPGIGKTMFARTAAKKLNTGFTYIDMASTSAAWVINGHSSSWADSKPGKIIDAMCNSPTASPIVLLDEIEKPVRADYDPKNALYQLLEENSAKSFVDEFIETPADVSTIIFIACANELEGIPEPLQTRFKVFHIQKPTDEEQVKIIQNIYKEETNSSPLFTPTLSTEIVSLLLQEAPRVVKSKISNAIAKTLLEYSKDEIRNLRQLNQQIIIRAEHFETEKPKQKNRIGF